MADDLSVGAAKAYAEMQMGQRAQEITMKIVRARAEQDQALVAMLMDRVQEMQSIMYDESGARTQVPRISEIDTTV
jgi:hypothetical protein